MFAGNHLECFVRASEKKHKHWTHKNRVAFSAFILEHFYSWRQSVNIKTHWPCMLLVLQINNASKITKTKRTKITLCKRCVFSWISKNNAKYRALWNRTQTNEQPQQHKIVKAYRQNWLMVSSLSKGVHAVFTVIL